MDHIKTNLAHIKRQISRAAAGAPDAGKVRIMAVSKKQPESRIEEVLDAGQRLFGENRVQEAASRWQARRVRYPDLEIHLIGPLQTNKVKEAVALFDAIQTLDREKLAAALAAEMQAQKRFLPCFVQVNTGAEPQKSGVLPEETASFVTLCRDQYGLDVVGLMCLPPANEPPALHFALLKKLADESGLPERSMGMSADFEKAVPLGATYLRLGTALFGARPGHE